MPSYPYACDACGHAEDHFQKMSDRPLKKCPACNGNTYERRFSEPNAIVRGDPKTIGQAAEENAKRVGKEQLQLMAEADKQRIKAATSKLPDGARSIRHEAAVPPWRDGTIGTRVSDKPLDLKTVKDPNKYIQTGKL